MRGLGELEVLQVVMEIFCVWCVVIQKREMVFFGVGDGGGWSLGVDVCLGGVGEGVVIKEVWFFDLFWRWVGKGS